MNTNTRILLDEADYRSANVALVAEIVALESRLSAAGNAVPNRPTCDATNVITTNDALAAHKATLQGALSVGAKPAAPVASNPKTLTEKVLAAKGVKSLAELNAKHQNRKPQPGD